jgi:hypothetical protein
MSGAPTITAADLTRALEGALGPLRRLERRPSPYRSSFALEELDVWLADGTALQLVFKDLGWHTLLEQGRRAKPSFLYDPLRELRLYQHVLGPAALGTAACYAAVAGPERHWLFLEKVPGEELYQVGDFAAWQRAARWLAGLHVCFAGQAERLRAEIPLLGHDADYYHLWLRRAQAFSPSARLAWLASRYDRLIDRLTALPVTLLHGEFYASNVLVEAQGSRVCPIDWEMAAVGPGLTDLAALTAGRLSDEQRRGLAKAYLDALPGGADEEQSLQLLDCCRLQAAVQWLGWSPDWRPPAEHAQDWLGVAIFACGAAAGVKP